MTPESSSAPPDDPCVVDDIHVLLVDDNEQWARLLADDLERHGSSLKVTVVVSANEALLALDDHGSIDCVVADYQMPEVDGLQLLERVRERWPRLPYILTTAEGSERVASAAIDAGAVDYLIKDPNAMQTASVVGKIEAAVEGARLQRALEESEQRYRTVTEQSRDAIVILREGRLVFANRQLYELVDQSRGTLESGDFVDAVIHPADHDQVRTAVAAWHDGAVEPALHEARLLGSDGAVRHCEYTGRSITYRSARAALISIRDVTRRKRRERELEWERNLNRTVQQVLVQSRTRGDLEARIAEQLVDHGYALAWIGESKEGALIPRVVEGSNASYVDERELRVDASERDGELSVVALRSGDPRFVDDVSTLFETEWRAAALDRGFRSGAALPLIHDEVSYGVLAVYHEEPNRFTDFERRLLTDLADTVAYAIHGLEASRALASDHLVEATVEVRGSAYYLFEVLQDATDGATAEITVHSTLPHGDDTIRQYLSLEGLSFEAFHEAATARSAVRAVTLITDEDDTRVQVVLADSTPETDLASFGIIVCSTSVTAARARIRVEFSATTDFRSALDSLTESYGSASLLTYTESDRSDAVLPTVRNVDVGVLTEKQAAALEAAFYHGYFERPRQNSASEVATSLGVSHTTFLQHLRVAQQKLLENLFS